MTAISLVSQQSMSELRHHALQLLRASLADPQAAFRDGQWESIAALLQGKRLLVVQCTGWGKSGVYFITTRLLRDRGAGPALLISPLLSLMRDQVRSAERFGIRAATVHSDNRNDWEDVRQRLQDDAIDLLLVSPERLANRTFLREFLEPVAPRVGMVVVDEAHCISDWGHDFRPDYQRIPCILPLLPPDVRLVATTATANDRVIADIRRQFGDRLEVQRGPLARKSLHLQNIPQPDPAAKMAWLAEHLPQLREAGSGIVYTLTVRTANRVAAWLQTKGIRAEAYTAQLEEGERERLESLLLNNEVDALVATTALGMGFDKPDLGFVVHFQLPASVVHYYQQVGRAGRSLAKAHGILLSSPDDDDVNDYFIENALPPVGEVQRILDALRCSGSAKPLSSFALESCVNLSSTRIKHVLKVLSVEDPPIVEEVKGGWRLANGCYSVQQYQEKEERLRSLRRCEQAEMQRYLGADRCLMQFLAEALTDPFATACGGCAVCRNEPLFLTQTNRLWEEEARDFIRQQTGDLVIEPRKKWPSHMPCQEYSWVSGMIPERERAEAGRALCVWNDPGWGRLVAQGYRDGGFDLQLIEPLATLVRLWNPMPAPQWVTSVPSASRPDAMRHVGRQLADVLGIPFIDCVRKVRTAQPQQTMANSWHRVHNRDGVYEVAMPPKLEGAPVLLLDDIVDTRWTFTVVVALLRRTGGGPAYPLALASRR